MSVPVKCEDCSKTYQVGEQHIGKVLRCKACGAAMPVNSDDSLGGIPPVPRSKKPSLKKKTKSSKGKRSVAKQSSIVTGIILALVVARFALRAVKLVNPNWANNVAGAQAQPAAGEKGTVAAIAGISDDPHQLFPIGENAVSPPDFNSSNFNQSERGQFEFHTLKQMLATKSPAGSGRMQLQVYLPRGEHQPGSLPCVLVPPAGTMLINGIAADNVPENPEHLPYVDDGFVVVTFSLDGWLSDEGVTAQALAGAYKQFAAASAGLANADIAYRFAKTRLEIVDPSQIYIAGHSSAGTLALLYAAHQPELAGCIAYAPETDVASHVDEILQQFPIESLLPGVRQFAEQSSPLNHVSQITCPVLAFHARGDTVCSAAKTKLFCEKLKKAGGSVNFIESAGSDHYMTMVEEGVPAGLKWLSKHQSPATDSDAKIAATSLASNQSTEPVDDPQPSPKPDTKDPLTPVTPSAGMKPSPAPQSAAMNSDAPQGTRPVTDFSELQPGMRIIAKRFNGWDAAEIVDLSIGQKITVTYLRLNSAFDETLTVEEVRIPMTLSELDPQSVATLAFELTRNNRANPVDRDRLESELLKLVGYVPESTEIDKRYQVLQLKVVRGSDAEQKAKFALLRSKIFFGRTATR